MIIAVGKTAIPLEPRIEFIASEPSNSWFDFSLFEDSSERRTVNISNPEKISRPEKI